MLLIFAVYQALQVLLSPIFIFYLLARKLRKKTVFGSFSERIGLVPLSAKSKHIVWIHAVSVGEVLSTQALIDSIKKNNPNALCYLTVGTISGKQMALKKLKADYVSFLPFDFLPFMLLAYKRIRPSRLILIEAELWPNFLMLAHFKKIKTSLINARISKRSKKSYHLFKRFYLPIISIFDKIYLQSDDDLQAFLALGVDKKKLQTLGDIKAYNVLEKQKLEPQAPPFIAPSGTTLLVGSLHPGELDVYLELFTILKTDYPSLKMIIAPRHFHWKDELIKKVEATNSRYIVWDEEIVWDKKTAPRGQDQWDILLVCKLGELFKLYQNATLFFLGGTFVPIGGHNLLEPAVWGKPTLIGPYHENCRVIAKKLANNNAIIAVANKDELIENVRLLLQDKDRVKIMGKNARQWLEHEAGIIKTALNQFLKN